MQIVSGDITRDITGEIVYLKAYKQMVGEVTGSLLLCIERRLGGCVRL